MKIRGLTHRMKNRIREHGDEWIECGHQGRLGSDGHPATVTAICIMPVNHVRSKEPYMRWVIVGKDIEVVEK